MIGIFVLQLLPPAVPAPPPSGHPGGPPGVFQFVILGIVHSGDDGKSPLVDREDGEHGATAGHGSWGC